MNPLAKVVIKFLTKQFKLDKLAELMKKVNNHEDRIRIVESMSHPKRNFVQCNTCKQQIEQDEEID